MAVKVPSMVRAASLLFICPQVLWSASPQAALRGFFDQHCLECHDSQVKKGGLDLSELNWTPESRENFDLWVKVHDRVQKGEMPPKKKAKNIDEQPAVPETAKKVEKPVAPKPEEKKE